MKQRHTKTRVPVAVREFALPAPRTGSIESHSGFGLLSSSGQEAHRLAQLRRCAEVKGYESEQKVFISFVRGPYEFAISGRMDGTFVSHGKRIIEEIKTAFDAAKLKRKLEREPWHPYVLQAMTYGYAMENALRLSGDKTPVEVRLRVVSARTMEGEDFDVPYERVSYEAWVERRLEELVHEQKIRERITARRKRESPLLKFPFPSPRAGQRELIEAIEDGARDGKRLLLQAPTGLGKTAGVIYPLLKEALSRGQPIVYVTPKNSQHELAVETVRGLQASGAKIKSISLTAKAKLCFKDEPICDPERCEFARDHYQKMAEHNVVDHLAKKKNITALGVRKIAEAYEVCPFELSLEAISRTDVVIGDYNYVFAPRNVMARITDPAVPKSQRPNLAIDEAHCLPSRAVEYFSPELSVESLERLRERFRGLPKTFAREGEVLLGRALDIVRAHRPSRAGDAKISPKLEDFVEHDGALGEYVGRYLASDARIEAGDPALRLRNEWSEFANGAALAAGAEGGGRFAVVHRDSGGGALKVVCCDASAELRPTYDSFANVAAFSATLKPFQYYATLAGLDGEDCRRQEFQSPFRADQRKVLVIPQVSTKWSERSANYAKIAEAIARIAAVRPGNYAAFFPSFDFLEQVAQRLRTPGFELLRQIRNPQRGQVGGGGRSAQVKSVLERLREPDRPAILLAVQGGVFSEGVDFPGEMLVGAIVVGPALPGFGIEREIMRAYFESKYGAGFDYAYAFPAMAKSVQSAGRVIRTETDRGLIVLMDGRFLTKSFSQGMPSDWFEASAGELVSNQVLTDVSRFWAGENGS